MVEAGVRQVKNRLSEYLRRVRQGERVVITDRGRPVAVLIGLDAQGSEAAWSMVRSGLAEWSGGKPRGGKSRPRAEGRPAEQAVLDGRLNEAVFSEVPEVCAEATGAEDPGVQGEAQWAPSPR